MIHHLRCQRVVGKGRCAFSEIHCGPNYLLERAPVRELSVEDKLIVDQTDLADLLFVHPDKYIPGDPATPGLLVVGAASYCAHSPEPNARVQFVRDEDGDLWCDVLSIGPIMRDAEVKISYTNIDAPCYRGHLGWPR